MISPGSQITLYCHGAYNSDEHLVIYVIVRNDGYDLISEADSLYDKTVKGSRCRVPFGFFFTSGQFICVRLKQSGIIPGGLSHMQIRLNTEVADELYQYDKARVQSTRSNSVAEREP